jgi:hypothetical protein
MHFTTQITFISGLKHKPTIPTYTDLRITQI